MIYSRRYSRNFVPLKQDSNKYNLDFRPSLGRCVIEIKDGKGKINIYAQGIKPKTTYHLELVGFEKGNIKNVCLGNFSVDNYGKGDFSTIFNPDNINNTNNKIEDFSVISVMVKNENDICSALAGYIENEIDWHDQYKAQAIINLPICKPYNDKDDNQQNGNEDKEKSEFEKGLDEKEEGLLEREQGLLDKEEGLLEKEKSTEKIPLNDYEEQLNDKLKWLKEKEDGLLEKEEGLNQREQALRQGFLPAENKELREREQELINKETKLINKEQELINKEKQLVRKNPTSEREKQLIEKEKGILEREQGLLDREKGLLEKEKGLLELEKGLRQKNPPKQQENNENNINPSQTQQSNHQNFKSMLETLKRNIRNIENMDINQIPFNSHIDYIKSKNITMSPFSTKHQNITWHRISPQDLTGLCENSRKYTNNPFVFTCYKKYKHLMLGIDNSGDKENYILAVPCRYEKDFCLKSFNEFLAIDNNVTTTSICDGEYGYRLENL